MGCGASREKDTEERQRNREIDDGIQNDKIALQNQVKILLLGELNTSL